MSLPSLAALPLRTEAPALPKPTRQKKPKNDKEVFFLARDGEPNGMLSNLFGNVEWEFQKVKFKEGSVVAKFLDDGIQKIKNDAYTTDEFKAQFKALYPAGKPETYIHPGATAFGILAKLVSQICKQPKGTQNDTGFKRLKTLLKNENYIFFGPGQGGDDAKTYGENISMTYADFQAWQDQYVNKEKQAHEKEALLLDFNREKYNKTPFFRRILLSTGSKEIHERVRGLSVDAYNYLTDETYEKVLVRDQHRRSIVNKIKNGESVNEDDADFWYKAFKEEIQVARQKILANDDENKYKTDGPPPFRGGDMTGRVLMRVRDEIRVEIARAQNADASCSTDV